MLFKHVICYVDDAQKDDFHNAQLCWEVLKKAPGFLCQFGGWEESDQLKAHVFALWKDEADYRHFMEEIHDEIFLDSNQKQTYRHIEVTLEKMDVPIERVKELLAGNSDDLMKDFRYTQVKEWTIVGQELS